MKRKQIFKATLLIAVISVAIGCEKNKSICRTCFARYGGNTIEKKACSAQEEQDFKTQYYYAEVSCR